MKDQDLVNALRCVSTAGGPIGDCKKCPFCKTEPVPKNLKKTVTLTEWSSCDVNAVWLAATDRIANQNTHILALQKEIAGLRKAVRWVHDGLYLCDPEKNTVCKKSGCKKQCFHTAFPAFADAWAETPAPQLRWIPVAERLPEDRSNVLVVAYWHERWGVYMGWCAPERAAWSVHIGIGDRNDVAVTHWMPLPEPPEVENAEAK